MNRRNFLQLVSATPAAFSGVTIFFPKSARGAEEKITAQKGQQNLSADLIIAGGGLGGCAAALAALQNNLRVVMTEETDWIGGQLTQQGVPPDEHRWIESFGSTRVYREFRGAIRDFYRRNYPLTEAARARWNLNPGDGSVSKLCHEPRVAIAVFYELFARFLSSKKLTILLEHKVFSAEINGDKVKALSARNLRSGNEITLEAPYFIDATELGDLLPLTQTEFVTGAESQKETGELHAPEKANPQNQQAFTVCFAMDYLTGENHLIEKPREYNFWRDYVPQLQPKWPGKLFDFTYSNPQNLQPRKMVFDPENEAQGNVSGLWKYRRIASKANFQNGFYRGDISLVNWPQNDFLPGPLISVSEKEAAQNIERAGQLSLSLFYWLQTDAPRANGKTGFPELRLRGDILGTENGLAKYPYIREARRIKAVFTVREQHVGKQARAKFTDKNQSEIVAENFYDSVGVGSYNIDLHPSTSGDNYIDVPSLPFQIPLGALLPQRMQNLIPASKNIGTTHITNGCYRLHPVEWNIGESAGHLIAFALQKKVLPREVREKKTLLAEFQNRLRDSGLETHWPKGQF